uniref:(northern house mosquito) hypothetical protein n=1 Tax=Culex pipiens TaxID=7175 RepID=A0A8D8GCT8_CULPI
MSNFPYQVSSQNGHRAQAPATRNRPPPPPPPVQRPPPPQPPSPGTTEHDAVNQRFLERLEPEQAQCLSCGGTFSKETIAEVIRHYADAPHPQFYSACLYCGGKCHRYRDGKGIQVYHDCYRSTNKLDQ